ncbi:hypothetical protein TPSD3_10800 [Thioflexithrix psekupsensis]|uniref:Bacterial repeat domain-containing protein n=1 Tax=Thioflexithrix psekupsensis TaxID=1570016 RepID=A0A251X6A4_9GAMM|nr:hypothetical protein TPSD3_10800 [Thioflexithrix psekupsensis]
MTDAAGNVSNELAVSSFTVDTVAPTVTIEQASAQNDLTPVAPVLFTATFSKVVSNFDSADVTVGGTAPGASATVTEIAPNDGTTYQISVSGMTDAGTVTVSIAANKATDAAGNGNSASTSKDNEVTYSPPASVKITGNPTATEDGKTGTYSIALSRSPDMGNTVVISLTPDNQCTVNPTSVSLSNTDTTAITVTAVNDTTPEGAHSCVIKHQITAINASSVTVLDFFISKAMAADSNYSIGMAIADMTVAITDNDSGVIINPASVNAAESGATGAYTVVLSTEPALDVTITLTPNAQVTTRPATVTFTHTNWNTPQTVTVTAVDDTSVEGNHSGSVAHAITTGDGDGDGGNYPDTMTVASVNVSISDNDNPPSPPPPPPTDNTYYNLNLKTNGNGEGKITGKTTGQYANGTLIALKAEPAANSTFAAWNPEHCGDVFYLSGETTCTATFNLKTFHLSTDKAGSGSGQITVTPQGNSHIANTTITLTAIPESGSILSHWTPSNCANAFQLIADTSCTAWFETVVVPQPEPQPQPQPEPQPESTPPQLIKPLPDYVMTLGNSLSPLMLDEYFSGHDVLNYQVVSSPQIDMASIHANQLHFNHHLLQIGTVSFVVRATDGRHLFTEDTFLLTVGSPEPEPQEPQPEPIPQPKPETPMSTVSATVDCPVSAIEYNHTCNARGQLIAIQYLMPQGVVADGIIDQRIENQGWLINIEVTANGHIKGGKLSGYVNNNGVIEDIEFKGNTLQGGLLGGHIRNTSSIHGVLKNVQFKAGSIVEGGRISGQISGDPVNPVRLKGVTITNGSQLSHAIIDSNTKLPERITFGEGVRFANDFPCQVNGLSLKNGTQSTVCFKRLNGLIQITINPDHRGQWGEVIFAAADNAEQAYSHDGENWQQIPIDVAEILTAKTVDRLPLTLEVPLPDLSEFIAVYIGYRLEDGEIVYYQIK